MRTDSARLRYPLPDYCRGLAILLMFAFHGWYDLSVFGFVEMDFSSPFWRGLRGIIVSLFCLTAGASLYWAHHKGIRWRALGIRQGQLALGALLLTVFSLLAYPDAWIFFGILHFFVVSLLVSLPWVKAPVLATVAGFALIMAERLNMPGTDPWIHRALQPVLNLPDGSIDRMYLLPWLGVVWMGIGLGHMPWLKTPAHLPKLDWLQWMGQHPLSLYLIHQPILFGLAWLLYQTTA